MKKNMHEAIYFIPFKSNKKAKLNKDMLVMAAFPSTLLRFFLPAVTVTQYMLNQNL